MYLTGGSFLNDFTIYEIFKIVEWLKNTKNLLIDKFGLCV